MVDTGSDKTIIHGKVWKTIANGRELNKPNGIMVTANGEMFETLGVFTDTVGLNGNYAIDEVYVSPIMNYECIIGSELMDKIPEVRVKLRDLLKSVGVEELEDEKESIEEQVNNITIEEGDKQRLEELLYKTETCSPTRWKSWVHAT